MSALVSLEGLSVRYPRSTTPALEAVTMSVAQGEKLAIIGESGSGKSTLARALVDLLPRGSRCDGTITWQGGSPAPGRDYGYVFQDPGSSFDPILSIGAQMVEVLQTHFPLTRHDARVRAAALLARVQIPAPELALDAYPHQFSGGQKQRIAIAIAIATGPKLLIADEPTSALDTVVQAEIVALLQELVESDAMTLLFITHDIALASGLADRIAVFRNARLVEIGTANEIITAPRRSYTRGLVAAHLDLTTPVLIGDVP
ncbi:ATP-binding cassette domain-containing protein [Pseudorhodobacter aquimaris]|uniref:ATP-binding cassette domain-containing protein n=1 Tax=Pseudorhodobacter aquimaris TaxID=687412 RepID=UPI00067C70F7|nr:ABC transporter ATP-binding protein [Pseudorhodobacter aquimaris]